MRLDPPPRADVGESVAPMINVVFLLLIFFLMAATLRTPAAFETRPPASTTKDRAARAPELLISAEGRAAYRDVEGLEAALAAIAAEAPARAAIRADAQAPARLVAQAARRLRERGVAEIELRAAPAGR